MRKLLVFLSFLVVASMMLAACAPQGVQLKHLLRLRLQRQKHPLRQKRPPLRKHLAVQPVNILAPAC